MTLFAVRVDQLGHQAGIDVGWAPVNPRLNREGNRKQVVKLIRKAYTKPPSWKGPIRHLPLEL